MSAAFADTDALLAGAADGNREARGLLLDRYRARLKRMVSVRIDRRLLRRVDPSDVVQESLAIADRRLDDYLRERPIAFHVWMRQLAWDQLIALNRKHLYARSRSRRREEDLECPLSDESMAELAACLVDPRESGLSALVEVELRSRVRRAIDDLPPIYREILVLRYLEQLSMSEAAEVLDIKLSAAKMRHLRALAMLQEGIDRSNCEDI